jgi:hypothetical protein
MGTQRADTVDLRLIREVLAELNRTADLDAEQWADKRAAERRRLTIACKIRYLAPDGASVLTIDGHTRDVSVEGIGFIAQRHFRRSTPLHMMISANANKAKCLTGIVVYSRVVRDGMYLTGIRFAPREIAKLTEDAKGQDNPIDSKECGQPIGDNLDAHKPEGARERSLRFLNSAATTGISSNNQIDKIVVLSGSDDHEIRRAAVSALMQITSAAGRMGLEAMLRDPNSDIQVEAAEALGNLDARTAIDPLTELLKHKKPEVALRIAAVLGRLGDRSGIAVIRRHLAKNSPHARAAARALGVIVGRQFRLNSAGIAEARLHLKKL